MTTTEVLVGGAVVVVAVRQLRATFAEQLRADRSTLRRDLARIAVSAASGTALGAVAAVLTGDGSPNTSGQAPTTTRAGWRAGARWISAGARFAFLLWLYDITGGAAFSPFAFAQDVLGGPVWQPVLVALGLTEAVARVGALVVRAATSRRVGERLAVAPSTAGVPLTKR